MNKEKDAISVLDLVLIIVKHWKFIFIVTFISGIIILPLMVISKLIPSEKSFLPDEYTASTSIYFSSSSDNSISSLLGKSNALISLAGGVSSSKPSDLVNDLLLSNQVLDKIVEKSDRNFKEFYKLKNDGKNPPRNILRKNFSIATNKNTQIITISYKDIDPEFAFKTNKLAIEFLQNEYTRLAIEKGEEKFLFFQDRLKLAENEYEIAKNNFISFCKKYNIVNLESQVSNQLKKVADLNSSLLSKEIELKEAQNFRSSDDPVILQKKREIASIKNLIKQFDKGFTDFSFNKSIPTDKIQQISSEYANHKMEVDIKQQLLIVVRQQFETSRLETGNNFSNFQIIQKAELPESKSGPSRSKIIIIVVFLTGFLSTFLVFIYEFFKEITRDPEENSKLLDMKNYFRIRR